MSSPIRWPMPIPWLDSAIDWERTIAFRRHLWSLGLGVAEAMDTAQRGMGVDWPTSLELIRRSLEAREIFPGALVGCGAGTDHLEPSADVTSTTSSAPTRSNARDRKARRPHRADGKPRAGEGGAQRRRLRQGLWPHSQPGEGAGDHPLARRDVRSRTRGYWGTATTRSDDRRRRRDRGPCRQGRRREDSLLDKDKEIAMRRRLPQGVRMYTGDDFNYAELIAGDAQGFSDALLGIFDVIAPAAASALGRLTRGDSKTFHDILAPTVPLSRHIFKAPTRFYKTGVVFMAYLNGLQDHFTLVGGQESARSTLHLAELFRLADAAGLLADPDRAAGRMRT
jgi:hypothetical protein